MLPGLFQPLLQDSVNIYLFKVNNSNIRKRCGICSKKNNKDRRRSCVFIVNFEQISHLLSSVSIVDFEQKNDLWVCVFIKNSAEVLPTSMEKLKPETMKPRVLYKTMIRIGSNKYSRIWAKQNFPVLWLKIFLCFQRSFCFFHTWWYSSFSNISAKNIFYTRCFGFTCSK